MKKLWNRVDSLIQNRVVDACQFKYFRFRSKFLILLMAVLVLFLLELFIPTPVLADPGLTVSNAILVTDVSPGQTLTHRMTVSIATTDPATSIAVQVGGVMQYLDGSLGYSDSTKDTGPHSARSFITIAKNSFDLEPGGSQDVTATIQIPSDVGTGGRYAMIAISTVPSPGAGVKILSSVNVPVYLTVKDTQLTHTAQITKLSIGNITSGQPVDISTIFQNTGNHHYKVKGEVSVINEQGQTLDTISIPLTFSSIVPGTVRQIKATFTPSGELAPGTYIVNSKVLLEDGNILDEKNTTFEVKKAYVPPPALGNVTLTPSSAYTLKSDDGKISIYFPQGAAVVPVAISLRDYPSGELPIPQPDITLATTCFRVDGLTGLLAKDATLTVKYSTADLEKAGGDASRLRLARWDAGDSQYTVLTTKLDESAMTLSASTNQMSIWTVVVAAPSPSSSGISWWLVLYVVIGITLLATGAFVLLIRRRQ